MHLEERVVLITGAAGTIGREVCRQLGEQGAELLVSDVALDPITSLLDDLHGMGIRAWGGTVDAADPEAFRIFFDKANAHSGHKPVNALVNVAGTFRITNFIDSGFAEWDAMIKANLMTALVACRTVLPAMLAARSGTIVNFASTAGEFGSIRPAAAYAAAKAGVIGLTKSLAREVSPQGIRVNAISPGPIDTPALQAASEESRKAARARTLLGRMGLPADIAAGVLYLVSDDSSFITGTVLQVNGGALL